MTICIFGDSITWGARDPEGGGWASRLRNYFESKNGDVDVYNLGISGDTTTDLLDRIEAEARAREPNIIVLAIGINDAQFLHSTNGRRVAPGMFRDNLAKLLTIAKRITNTVIFVGLTRVDESKTQPIPWNTNKSYTNQSVERFDRAIEQFCNDHGAQYIPLADTVGTDDLADGLHPNAIGHAKIYERVRPVLEALL